MNLGSGWRQRVSVSLSRRLLTICLHRRKNMWHCYATLVINEKSNPFLHSDYTMGATKWEPIFILNHHHDSWTRSHRQETDRKSQEETVCLSQRKKLEIVDQWVSHEGNQVRLEKEADPNDDDDETWQAMTKWRRDWIIIIILSYDPKPVPSLSFMIIIRQFAFDINNTCVTRRGDVMCLRRDAHWFKEASSS